MLYQLSYFRIFAPTKIARFFGLSKLLLPFLSINNGKRKPSPSILSWYLPLLNLTACIIWRNKRDLDLTSCADKSSYPIQTAKAHIAPVQKQTSLLNRRITPREAHHKVQPPQQYFVRRCHPSRRGEGISQLRSYCSVSDRE